MTGSQFTFGKDPAAVILYDLVKDDPKLLTKVSGAFSMHMRRLHGLEAITDDHVYIWAIHQWQKEVKEHMSPEYCHWPEKVTTFARNVLLTQAKKVLR
jgi:hypothetical protein